MSTHPVRTCVGCRKRAARNELLRIVVEDSGSGPQVRPDPRRRARGRGAHLHPDPDCLALAIRRRAFTRAFRLTGSGSGVGTEQLETYVQQLAPTGGAPLADAEPEH